MKAALVGPCDICTAKTPANQAFAVCANLSSDAQAWPRRGITLSQILGRIPSRSISRGISRVTRASVAPLAASGLNQHLVPTPDSSDDFVRVCGPGEGFWMIVRLRDEAIDSGLEIDDGSEDAAAGAWQVWRRTLQQH